MPWDAILLKLSRRWAFTAFSNAYLDFGQYISHNLFRKTKNIKSGSLYVPLQYHRNSSPLTVTRCFYANTEKPIASSVNKLDGCLEQKWWSDIIY